MTVLPNPAVRNSSVRLFAGAFSRRHAASVTIGAFASLLFAPCGAFALSTSTLTVSPEVAKSNLVSAMDPAAEIIVQFTLPLSDRQGARDLLKHVSNPKDPLYRHYITVQEFAVRFGANAADYEAVRAWAVANGLSIVHEATARTSLSLSGTVAQLQKLFKTQLNYYKTPSGDQFYSAGVAPTVPSEIAPKIQALIGLTGGSQKASLYKIGKTLGENPETSSVHTDTAGGTGPGGAYAASDLRTAYQVPTFGGLSSQVVAVFEDSSLRASDFEKYLKSNKLPNITLKQIPVDQTKVTLNGDEVEAVLDVDMIAAINPDVKEIQVYAAPGAQSIGQFSQELVDVFDAVANAASQPGGPQTLSVSYGLDEIQMALGGGDLNAEADAINALGLAGVTVLVSAGDQGAYGRTGLDTSPVTLNAPDPGSQQFVTSVGGTTLLTGSGEVYGLETVWNELGIYPGAGATGGGVSAVWPNPEILPDYQGFDLVSLNGGNFEARNVPDVAAVADPETGVGIYVKDAGGWLQIGGTSASAPIWAGYVSILNSGAQYLFGTKNPVIGFFNPLLYFTATDFYPDGAFYPAGALNPILEGSNGNANLYGVAGYTAGQYYNNCCGLGSLWGPYAFQVLGVIASGSTPPPTVTIKAAPLTTSAKITWTKSTGATGYAVFVQLQVFDSNTGNYDPFLIGQTAITKQTSVDVKGLLANQLVLNSSGQAVPEFQYQVFVAAFDSTGASLSGPLDFFTKK